MIGVAHKKRSSESHPNSAPESKRMKSSSGNSPTKDSSVVADAEQATTANPLSILDKDSCKVQTLTVSDQHATLLLTHDDDDKKAVVETSNEDTSEKAENAKPVVRSLLKLTLVPFHKVILGCNHFYSSSDPQKPELNLLYHDPRASANIASFLKDYSYKLKSESGA